MASQPTAFGNKNSERGSLFLVVLLSILLSACQPPNRQETLVLTGPVMGTNFRISLVLDKGEDHSLLSDDVLKIMQSVDLAMLTYKRDSEVSRFNRAPAGQAFSLSPQTTAVVAESLSMYGLSDGYFDITVAPLVTAWGFGPDGAIQSTPAVAALDEIRTRVGSDKLSLEGDRLTKEIASLSIDLSAIAKGYAVDQVAVYLEQRGVLNYLIDIGGELRAAGRNIDKLVWRVGIERPEALGGIQQIVQLEDKAIATSGDYRNFLLLDGQKYSHMIDPTLGRPVLHKLALVSVIAATASRADALATAMMAMGEERAQAFAEKHGLAAYFVIRVAGQEEYQIKKSHEFVPYLQ